MKRVALTILLIGFIVFFGRPLFALAHEWQTDGAITVLLHTNPNDDPVADQPAELLFGITDTTKHFSVSNCDCAVTISKGAEQIASAPLTTLAPEPTIFSFSMPFTFPKAAVYHIVVTGSPKTSGAFQKFQVAYDLRVERDPNAVPSGLDWMSYLAIAGVVLIILISVYFVYREIKSEQKS